jgi:hypothetical protein
MQTVCVPFFLTCKRCCFFQYATVWPFFLKEIFNRVVLMLVNVQFIWCYFISIMQTVWFSFNMQNVLFFLICNRVASFFFFKEILNRVVLMLIKIDCVLFYFNYTILYVIYGSNLGWQLICNRVLFYFKN